MAQDSPINDIISKVSDFYNGENNKTAKVALLLVAGSLLAYTAYSYTSKTKEDQESKHESQPLVSSSYASPSKPKAKPKPKSKPKTKAPAKKEESKEDIERKKEMEEAAKKKEEGTKKILDWLINDALQLIPNDTGYNIRYFLTFLGKEQNKKGWENFEKYICASCGNVARDAVEIEQDGDEDEVIVMSEACAKRENKKYKPYKALRKMILKEQIILPDYHEPELIKKYMESEFDKASLENMSNEDNIFTKKCYFGALSKALNKALPKIAADEYDKRLKDEKLSEMRLKNGEIGDLDWKFEDIADTKDPLFMVSDDGKIAKPNKRSGTIKFGPYINAVKYAGRGKWEENWAYAGHVFTVELKISEADGCGVGFITDSFNQWIGKNEGNVNCLMLNQTGFFYTSRIFIHEWEPHRESPMGKWFKSDDIIVIIIDCTEAWNVKAQIYNKNNEKNKFEIEKLPKKIAIGVNVIVGSNPTGTVEPAATIISAKVERKL